MEFLRAGGDGGRVAEMSQNTVGDPDARLRGGFRQGTSHGVGYVTREDVRRIALIDLLERCIQFRYRRQLCGNYVSLQELIQPLGQLRRCPSPIGFVHLFRLSVAITYFDASVDT